jgi:hypothetical protein
VTTASGNWEQESVWGKSSNISFKVATLIYSQPRAKEIHQQPAVWSPSLPVIVVGVVDNEGYIPDLTMYKQSTNFPAARVDVFAPGWDIVCDGPKTKKDGTSQGHNPLFATQLLIIIGSLFCYHWSGLGH